MSITYYGSTKDEAVSEAWMAVYVDANSVATRMGKSMLSNGDSGNLMIWANCSANSDGLSCTNNPEGFATSYTLSKATCTTPKYVSSGYHYGDYEVTCKIKRTRCLKYKNGQEYMQNSSTEYTYYCCKSLTSDTHCKVR